MRLAVVAATACAAPAPAAHPAPEPEPPPLHHGPVTDYAPSAGLRWLVVVEPDTLFEQPELRQAVARLLTDDRLDDFGKASGVDPRSTSELLVAGYALGALYVVRARDRALQAAERFAARSVHGVARAEPHPDLARIDGVIGTTPQSFVRIGSDTFAVSIENPLLARTAEGFALGRFEKSPSVLRGAALSHVVDRVPPAPVRFYAPGPFTGEWARAASGVLEATLAVAMTISFERRDALRARLVLAGDFGEPAEARGALTPVLAAWERARASSLGRLLGVDQPLEGPRAGIEDGLLTFDVVLALDPLVSGLYAAVAGNVDDIMTGMAPNAPASGSTPAPGPSGNSL
jgi:hypothetical protein